MKNMALEKLKRLLKIPNLEYKGKSVVESEEFKGLCVFTILQFLALIALISCGATTILQACQGGSVLLVMGIMAKLKKLELMKLSFVLGATFVPCGLWTQQAHMPLTMPMFALAFPVYIIMSTSSYLYTYFVFSSFAAMTVFVARPLALQMFIRGNIDSMTLMFDTLVGWSFVMSVLITYVIGFLLRSRAKVMVELEEQRIVLEAAVKIKDMNKELKETLESKESLLLSISHEVRNPLNIINGCAELTLMRDLDGDTRMNVENIKASSELLTFFINNLLDASKMQRSELEINRVLVEMSSFLRRLWATSKILVAKKGLQGNMFIQKNFPKHLNVDPVRVLQIVYNLVSNAVKFTNSGYIAIVCSWINEDDYLSLENHIKPTNTNLFRQVLRKHHKDPNIPGTKHSWQNEKAMKSSFLDCNEDEAFTSSISSYSFSTRVKTISALDLEEHYLKIGLNENTSNKSSELERITMRTSKIEKGVGFLKIEVMDSGCGIPVHELSNLFKKFSQVGPSSHKQLGTGLGLWISQNLCQKMGGDLKAFSSENEGSVFVACLKCQARVDER